MVVPLWEFMSVRNFDCLNDSYLALDVSLGSSHTTIYCKNVENCFYLYPGACFNDDPIVFVWFCCEGFFCEVFFLAFKVIGTSLPPHQGTSVRGGFCLVVRESSWRDEVSPDKLGCDSAVTNQPLLTCSECVK